MDSAEKLRIFNATSDVAARTFAPGSYRLQLGFGVGSNDRVNMILNLTAVISVEEGAAEDDIARSLARMRDSIEQRSV